jgi:DNA-binding MarR family transcriptional regulator
MSKKTPLAGSPPADSIAFGHVEEAQILHRLLKLSNRLIAPFTTHLERRHKISVNEFRLLMMIGRHGEAASHQLSELTGVNTMSVSRAVSALQRHGRIEVTRDPSNRRRKTLQLTAEGRRLYETMLPTTDKVAGYLFSALRPDELMAFDRYVTTLTDALEATDTDGRSQFLEQTRPDSGDA